MCPRCYEETDGPKIIGANAVFLLQALSRKTNDTSDVTNMADYHDSTNKIASKYFNRETNELLTTVNLETNDSYNVKPNLSTIRPPATLYPVLQSLPKPRPPAFVPPRSPHNLIEEQLYSDPWCLLVATIFLNKTSCMQARPQIYRFLADHPDASSVLAKRPEDLEVYFESIGLRKRALQVWRMSDDYVNKGWKRSVRELHGIGKYGDDAYRMFCLGDFEVEPEDRFLRIYKAWYERYGRYL